MLFDPSELGDVKAKDGAEGGLTIFGAVVILVMVGRTMVNPMFVTHVPSKR